MMNMPFLLQTSYRSKCWSYKILFYPFLYVPYIVHVYTVPGSSCHNLAVDSVYCRDTQPLLSKSLEPYSSCPQPHRWDYGHDSKKAWQRDSEQKRLFGCPGALDALSTSLLGLSCILSKYTSRFGKIQGGVPQTMHYSQLFQPSGVFLAGQTQS